ncbi:MAG: hypothetical protein IKW51_08335 [Bacteroidales bacterium]|nr:hypothetical protein [Bacteroidales bacterium]
MAQKNDERIMQLKQQIEEKRKELANQTGRFTPVTNCLLVIDKVTYNLHIESSELLLIKVNMMAMSAKDLGLDISKVIISGYSLADWIDDIKNYMKVQSYKDEKRKLEKLEKQLDALLSDDKRTELEIDSIAALLG